MPNGNLYDSIVKRDPIVKGWSEDKKYCITTTGGINYLLRISPPARYETKKLVFSTMEQIAALGIPMCLPVEFGTCDEGAYTIQSWIDGIDLETILPLSSQTKLSATEQYALGLQAGKIAERIHTIPIPEPQEEWAVTSEFGRKVTLNLSQDVLRWYDHMQNPVPMWYLGGIGREGPHEDTKNDEK